MHGGLCAVQPHADVWQPHGLTISARSEVLLQSRARPAATGLTQKAEQQLSAI